MRKYHRTTLRLKWTYPIDKDGKIQHNWVDGNILTLCRLETPKGVVLLQVVKILMKCCRMSLDCLLRQNRSLEKEIYFLEARTCDP